MLMGFSRRVIYRVRGGGVVRGGGAARGKMHKTWMGVLPVQVLFDRARRLSLESANLDRRSREFERLQYRLEVCAVYTVEGQ